MNRYAAGNGTRNKWLSCMANANEFIEVDVSNEIIKDFFVKWKALNGEYKRMFQGEDVHLPFPDKVQKQLVMDYLNPVLINKVSDKEKNRTWDFDNCTELKSVTSEKGVVPFKATQKDCKRVLFMEITDEIKCYDIDVDKNRKLKDEIKKADGITRKQVSIKLMDYIKGSKCYKFKLE